VAATILAALNGSLHELRLLLMRDARVTCGLAPSKTAGFWKIPMMDPWDFVCLPT